MKRTTADRWSETAQAGARFPNLFLVGAPKCGTTSLAYYLSQHPDIFVPIIKEPVFFGSDLTATGHRLPVNDYLDLYRNWSSEKYALDASTHYFYSTKAATEISTTASNCKILMILRNPIDAAHSLYHQLRFDGREDFRSFESSLDAEPSRKRCPPSVISGFHETKFYSEIYRYSMNVRRYCEVFGNENVFVIIFDDIRQNSMKELQNICCFLNIDPNAVSRFNLAVKNSAKRSRARWVTKLANYPPHWVGYFTKPFFSRRVRVGVRGTLGRWNTVPATNPPMRPETRRRLIETFRPDVVWLAKFLGRDLSHWLEVDD